MNNRSFNLGVLLGLAGVVILLVLNAWLSCQNVWQVKEDARWVAHTQEVLTSLENVLSLAKDAETGQRGYLITGDPSYLEPYQTAVASIHQQVDELERLTVDNPLQQARFPEVRQRIQAKLKQLERTIALRKKEGFDAARQAVLTGRAKKEMDALRVVVGEMRQQERDLLRDRKRQTDRAYLTAVVTGLVTAVLGLASVALLVGLLERSQRTRLRATAVIHEQRQLLHATLASIGDAVIATDAEGRVTFLNPVACQLTGWTQQEARGQPLEVVFHIVNEQSCKQVENPALRALKQGTIVGLANHSVLIAKDGTERPIDDTAAPIQGEEGTLSGAVLVFRDVSERRREERALRESEQRRRFVMDAMPEKIFTARPNGDRDYFNPVWFQYTGLSLEQLKDWGWTQLIHLDDLEEKVHSWRHSLDTGEPFQFEHRLRRADGEYRWHLSRALPLRDETGRVLMWVGSNTDIHEPRQTTDKLRQLAAELSEADRKKDEFLATLAHELRSPLAPIRNGLQLMRLAGREPALVEQARAMMERQLTQLVRLVDDLMDVSCIARGRLELRKDFVQLSAVINSAVEASRPLIEEMGHELAVTLPMQPVVLVADLARLAQVFMNLLTNAAKYTDRQGQIWLTAEQQGSDVVVSVKDTGIGIDADQLSSIFGMFAQVDRSLEKAQGGLGIGLTLVRRLVEMHGGTVEARSDGLGQGSVFLVRLPVVEAVGSQTASGDEPAPLQSSLRILIVDDNQDGADSLAMMLQVLGNETRTAYDGQQGIEVAEEFRPDVILLDLRLPKLNGYEACGRIREQPWAKGVVLIAVTGWGQEDDHRRSHEAGFDYHLVKPVDPQALMKLLAGLSDATKR
jgi:PAS domain S-box-containing protein